MTESDDTILGTQAKKKKIQKHLDPTSSLVKLTSIPSSRKFPRLRKMVMQNNCLGTRHNQE